MNLDSLKLYCDVVRLRSFSRAAAANGVTQSAASQSIQQLELDLDVPLLDRSRRPLVATEAGRLFFDACRDLLAGFEKARADLLASRELVEGTVRVAAIYSVGLHDMSRHMQPFMSAHPHARVLLECLHPHKVVEAVLNDEADVGVLSYPTATRALNVLPLRSEPMVLVTHPSHRLAKRKQVEAGDLAGEKFIAFDRDLAVRRAIDRALKHHGVKVNVVMEFDNVETIKQAIGIAAGVSILPKPTVVMESGMRTLATVPLGLSGLARPIGLIYRRGRRPTPAVARFIETLRKADESPAD
jgi:DNA-binding transcriptional LysR family regulator